MATSIEKIRMLVELEDQKVSDAVQVLKNSQSQHEAEANQLVALENYLVELQQSVKTSGTGLHPTQLASKHAFLDKLHKAVVAQEKEVESAKSAEEEARQLWIEKRSRMQALEKLLLRLEKSEIKRLNHAEQKLLDELSAQNFIKNHAHS